MRHPLLVLALALAACTEAAPVDADDAALLGGPAPAPEPAWDGGTAPPSPPSQSPPSQSPPSQSPPSQSPPSQSPPSDPPSDPADPNPADPADPPPVDACADAGDACNTCACRLCAAELDACFADAACQAVVDCARRTGCGGLDCLQSCGAEIEAAGGPFSASVGRAQAVSDCRDNRCGTSDAECAQNDPGPPQPPPVDPNEPEPNEPEPNEPDPADPNEPVDPNEPNEPPAGDCARFPADEFCGEGVDAAGVAWCEFYVVARGDSCDEVCGRAGSFCLMAFDDERGDCEPDNRQDCDDGERDLICRCAR